MTRERFGQSAMPRFNRYSIPPEPGTIECTYCTKFVKPNGLADHIKAVHPEKAR